MKYTYEIPTVFPMNFNFSWVATAPTKSLQCHENAMKFYRHFMAYETIYGSYPLK